MDAEGHAELDARVAARVFGADVIRQPRTLRWGYRQTAGRDDYVEARAIPSYSTEAVKALEVFNAMLKRAGAGEIRASARDRGRHTDPLVTVTFGQAGETQASYTGLLPRAICEAAVLYLTRTASQATVGESIVEWLEGALTQVAETQQDGMLLMWWKGKAVRVSVQPVDVPS